MSNIQKNKQLDEPLTAGIIFPVIKVSYFTSGFKKKALYVYLIFLLL